MMEKLGRKLKPECIPGTNGRSCLLVNVILFFSITLGCGGRPVQDVTVLERSSEVRERVVFDASSKPSVDLSLLATTVVLSVKRLAHRYEGVETARTVVDREGTPRKDTNISWGAPTKSELLPLKMESVSIRIAGLGEWTCETDNDGRCERDLNEEELAQLFPLKSIDVLIELGGKFISKGAINFAIQEDFKAARARFFEKQAQERFDKFLADTRADLETAVDLCAKKKVDPAILKDAIVSAREKVVQLAETDDPPPDVGAKFDDLKSTCFRHAKRLVAEGDKFGKQKHFTEAIEFYRVVQAMWPDSKIANVDARSGISTAESFIEEFKPEKIKELNVLREGDGLTMYLALVNKDEAYTAVPGKIVYQIFLRNGGARIDRCYEKTGLVKEEYFKNVVVGRGVFQREMTVLKLPFLKWRDFSCHAVKSYMEMGGLAGLERIPYTWDFSLQVLFKPDNGEKLEAIETFRP